MEEEEEEEEEKDQANEAELTARENGLRTRIRAAEARGAPIEHLENLRGDLLFVQGRIADMQAHQADAYENELRARI